jgi:ribonucleotide monophosphatase NagD (HAD superfamily)
MPGKMLAKYIEMGGRSFSFGKPNRDFFLDAISMAKNACNRKTIASSAKSTTKPFRVLHIGDSLHHDILGAHNACVDSCMVTRHGVHKKALYATSIHSTEGISESAYDAICDDYNIKTPSSKQTILNRVIELCDDEEIVRPTYIIEDLVW